MTYPDHCAEVFYNKESFKEHIRHVHNITDKAAVKQKKKACHIGCNGQRAFWCGFCCQIVKLAKKGTEAWDEKFDHIDNKHYRMKMNIDDWWEINGKIKGDKDADGGRGSGGKGKKSGGRGGMDMDTGSEEEDNDDDGSGSDNDEEEFDARGAEHDRGMNYDISYGQEMAIHMDQNDFGVEQSQMEQQVGLEETQMISRCGENNDANVDTEMHDDFENEPSQNLQHPIYQQRQDDKKASATYHHQAAPLQPNSSSNTENPPPQSSTTRTTRNNRWYCVRLSFPLFKFKYYSSTLLKSHHTHPSKYSFSSQTSSAPASLQNLQQPSLPSPNLENFPQRQY